MTRIHAGARTCPHCRRLFVAWILEEGRLPSQVAREFKVSAPTVRKWVRRYKVLGILGLNDRSSAPHHSPLRQLKPGKILNDAIMELLHSPPSSHGFNRTAWRIKDIKAALDGQGHIATLNSIRTSIRNSGLRWKRARVALTSTDPEYREKLDAIKTVLGKLSADEAFFSIDELGPVAVKMRQGRSLQAAGRTRTIPQWQKSRGNFILTAALDLAKNQVVYLFSERKNTDETSRLIERLRDEYSGFRTLYLSWDAAPWHASRKLRGHILDLNGAAAFDKRPRIQILPLPTSAQFLNVIESVFSGLARAVLHNSDYTTVEDAKAAVSNYLEERNAEFRRHPKRAGEKIWRRERVPAQFVEANNCKDPRWMG